MYIRAYLRASTEDQDASRAKEQLDNFVASHNKTSTTYYYVENESGASLQRPELFRLLSESHPGDILLVEQVDRLSRLTDGDWKKLRGIISEKGVKVVALDLPTSHQLLANTTTDAFTGRMLSAINDMLLDMLAAIARKDYEDRRRRQAQGIERAKDQGQYKGRPIDADLHRRILSCLDDGKSLRKTADIVGCALSTVQRAKAMKELAA